MSEYEYKRNGDEFTFYWRSAGIGINVTQLRESRDELHAELWIKSTLPDQPAHVHWGKHNLSSIQSREKLALALKTRLKEVPWSQFLEIVCTKTAIEYRRGEPIIDLAEAGPPQPNKFLVSKLLPQNATTIFYGDGDSCKSLVALLVGIAVSTDTPLPNGIRPIEQGPVLYLDWESDIDDLKERIRAMTIGLHLSDLPHIHYRRQYRPITDDLAVLKTDVAKIGAKLVIVDSLGPAVGASLRDEQEAIPAMNAVRALGSTALAIAHITKADARNEVSNSMPLGSIMFKNLARSTWEFRRAQGMDPSVATIGMYHRKMNRGPRQVEPLGFRFRFFNENDQAEMIEVSGTNVLVDDDLSQYAALQHRLRAHLARGAMSIEALVEATDAKKDSVRKALERHSDIFQLLPIADNDKRNLSVWGLKAREAS